MGKSPPDGGKRKKRDAHTHTCLVHNTCQGLHHPIHCDLSILSKGVVQVDGHLHRKVFDQGRATGWMIFSLLVDSLATRDVSQSRTVPHTHPSLLYVDRLGKVTSCRYLS